MRPPRLVGNTGEQGEFVLPLNVPSTDGKTLKTDDFTFSAASWTLTAHEARPGHEMQFAAIIEAGVSTARALFSFNSTNVEGWGLYAERVVQPFMPAEGKLISLQHRLMRAARAYLDPELQAGTITPDQAFKILTTDVVLSEAMARQEVDRYTFRAPGQATSYFYGYTRLVELRADVEKAMGASFNQQAFHDFVLAQGLLPPALMREAVTARFVKRVAAGEAHAARRRRAGFSHEWTPLGPARISSRRGPCSFQPGALPRIDSSARRPRSLLPIARVRRTRSA